MQRSLQSFIHHSAPQLAGRFDSSLWQQILLGTDSSRRPSNMLLLPLAPSMKDCCPEQATGTPVIPEDVASHSSNAIRAFNI